MLIYVQQLTAAATKALERIFTICDKDRNGLLDDFEINEFQKRVFGSPLQQQELDGVKSMVRAQYPDAVVDNCISVEGDFARMGTVSCFRLHLSALRLCFARQVGNNMGSIA